MNKTNFKLLIILLFPIFTCSCWNYNELNELAIATALGIDKKDGNYEISVTIANAINTQTSAKEGQSQITVLTGQGKTISTAMDQIDLKNPKHLYLNHLTGIFISEDVAKDGVNNILDLLLREPESRKRFFLLITKNEKAKDVLKILTALDARPSQNIAATIESSAQNQAIATKLTYSNFIDNLITDGIQPVLNTIEIKGNKKKGEDYENVQSATPDATIKIGPLALFKDDKFKTFTNEKESEGINIVLGHANKLTVQTKCNDNYIVAFINNIKSKTMVKLENNKPSININVNGKGELSEVNCNVDLMKNTVINKIKNDLENETEKAIKKSIKKAQKNKTDVFAFGMITRAKYPKYYKKIKSKWDDEIFSNLKVKIKVTYDIETKGSLEQSIRKVEK